MTGRISVVVKLTFLLITGIIIFSLNITVPETVKDDFNSVLGENSFQFLINTLLLPLIFYLALVVLLLFLLNSLLRSDRISKMTPSTKNTIKVMGRMVIIPFCMIAYLNGFETFQGTLLGVAALFGTAIGFASTTTIGNLLSGLYLMLIRPFSIGDYILLLGQKTEGIVKEISINYTKIELPTGNTVLYANNSLLNQAIINTVIKKKEKDSKGKEVFNQYYKYGLTWGLPAADSHQIAVKTIETTIMEYKENVTEPITWFILSRDKFERLYQINLIVKEASLLLSLTSDFLTSLVKNYENLKENTIK